MSDLALTKPRTKPHIESRPDRTGGATSRGVKSGASGGTAKKPGQKEHSAQVRLFKLLRERGIPGLLAFAVPNAAVRSPNEWQRMKAEGFMTGAADIVFSIPPNGRGAYLEMKREKGGRIEDDQRYFARKAIESGALHAFARGFDEAVEVLCLWGLLRVDGMWANVPLPGRIQP